MNQRGFATLEVILMVMVIGILASIAVPRFTSVTTAANTAKIQSDLATIDTAIAVYHMDYGEDKTPTIPQLVTAGYLQAAPTSPSGYAYEDGGTEPVSISDKSYNINNDGKATFDDKTADKFYVPKKTETNSGGSGSGSGSGGSGD